MSDDTNLWVVPAISAGYTVQNDPDGRLRFFTDTAEVIFRCGQWIGRDMIDQDRHYPDLKTALENER